MTRAALLAVMVLAGCQIDPAPPAVGEIPGPDECGRQAWLQAIGKNIDTLDIPQGKPLRIIRPGMAVTLDYFPERLNIHVDDKGRVLDVNCG